MLGGQGYFRGSSILVSGTAGTGKTSLAAHLVDAACRRGERCLYFAFEESQDQMVRNMRSIGIDLAPWLEKKLLRFHASRPSLLGLESHLVCMHKMVAEFRPSLVVVDPLSSFTSTGSPLEVNAMLLRLVDFLKVEQITAFLTSLTSGGGNMEKTEVEISSLIDTWILLRDIESAGERNRGLYVLKSRGMAHSNQIREFVLTAKGVDLLNVYSGPEGVLTGSLREAQEARERDAELTRRQSIERKKRDLQRRRKALEAQIAALQSEFDSVEEEAMVIASEDQAREDAFARGRSSMAERRGIDATEAAPRARSAASKHEPFKKRARS